MNFHLIGSCETLPAGAHALPGGLATGHFVLAPDAVTATLGPSVGVHGPHSGSAGALAVPSLHIERLFMVMPID